MITKVVEEISCFFSRPNMVIDNCKKSGDIEFIQQLFLKKIFFLINQKQ